MGLDRRRCRHRCGHGSRSAGRYREACRRVQSEMGSIARHGSSRCGALASRGSPGIEHHGSDPDHQQDDNSRDPDDSSKAPRNGPTGGCPDVVRSFGRSLTIGDLEIRDGNRLESARLVRGRRGGSSHGSYSGSAQRYVLTPNSPSVPWSHISRSRSSMTLAMHPGSNERSDGATAYQESILEDRCQKEIAVQAQGRAPYTDN